MFVIVGGRSKPLVRVLRLGEGPARLHPGKVAAAGLHYLSMWKITRKMGLF